MHHLTRQELHTAAGSQVWNNLPSYLGQDISSMVIYGIHKSDPTLRVLHPIDFCCHKSTGDTGVIL